MSVRVLLPLCVLGLFGAAFFGPAAPATQADEPRIEVHEGIVYGHGGDQELRLDLARPRTAKGRLPTVLLLHGGGWIRGDKRDVLPIVRLLAEEGYVAVTAQYRLARLGGDPRRNPAPWPAQIEDVKCAVRYLRANAARWSIDPERIAAMGFSAGAHLAMLLGTMDTADGCEGTGGCAEASSKVDAVVSFFGPTDMGVRAPSPAEIAKLSLKEKQRVAKAWALGAIFGPRFREDPTRASPLSYVDATDAPMLLFQGTRDTLVQPENAELMMDALTRAGVGGKVVFHLGKGHGRGWLKDPIATDAMQDVLDFLDEQFRPGRIRSLAERMR